MGRSITGIGILLVGSAILGAGAGAAPPPPAAEGAHAALSCNACHLRGRGETPRAAAERRCAGCHAAQPSARGAFHRARGRGCLSCHAFHAPTRVRTGRGDLDLQAMRAADPAHCRACHAEGPLANLSAAHAAAGRLYHDDVAALADGSPSAGCLACHDRTSRSPWRKASEGRELTFYLHASHPQGVRVVPGSGRGAARIQPVLDPRIPLFDGRIECQTCHDLTVGTRFLKRAFAERDGLCLGCHRVGPGPARGGEAAVASLGGAP